ncbi:MAG: hypothetical protein FJY42_13930, partial [Betaproteobacteria bacterium]|nr:hypothetical protein [Betaproteobacteria bacterium]
MPRLDAAKSGAKTGVACLIALCGALLRKSVRGGLVVVGEVTLGGIERRTTLHGSDRNVVLSQEIRKRLKRHRKVHVLRD